MIEETIVQFLGERLDVPVYAESPETPPASFVLIEKTSGGQQEHIRSATLAVQSYAPRMIEAARLNEQVIHVMFRAIALAEIARIALNSDYNFTDTSKKGYRYQAIFDVLYY